MSMFNKIYATPPNLTELEILKTIRTALYEVGYPGSKYLEKLQIIAVIYQLYRAKDLARDLQRKGDYPFKDLITSIYVDIDGLSREFEYLRDHPTIDRCDLAKEKLFEIRDKMIKLSKNVGITDGEISNILRDYAPKPNEDLTSYRQKKYRR
ncbi:MAG: hypothetical protein APG08_01236 [Candidatus Methanofastidiosum methylothiophilum]|jgi:hypothetical protein|uniref:Uncharacterized protein n=1 Tax=Candidatus Methanofastidiosum methylothiophilum TaxID=1705564 RepID=A0A150JFV6_9EURY|nr:MAG: hypothetical protein AN188_01183 [Candidatus Methanofastidiosum methylthiophilus]OQC51708.1 MAG: hypothetical protein BWX56_00802 [Euryarchaeota archaeon ADurb.Bin023]HNV94158.1 hypothetical protein [Methanofastidiosum sp.]KYC56045.1 MAG: hypothetical protein APG08_01236 [Candidatus Methanofastidiosum methylthiophilus]KYC56931.1 MAG: hypothetical protein APG09_01258 [Candidatus Methanofastidiosum methylthiophilus]